ncbi:MAG: YeeE/YedE thiosulfate transporter family protein [Melioribacteraceae bacterium]
MGPLVPEIIGNELNFVVALFIGIAFGFVLEQAGFSTSKKLVGLFYGYDFTVLRVFYTAGLTAMIGVIALSHFGLLDMSLVYVNPTFLWSAIVGGLIMGLGFVVGGFCPGTSVCAAAIGKIDAMIFIGGSIIGVFIFAEGYPLFEGLYKAASWGNVRIFDTLGMSQALFAFLLTAIAIAAFVATTIIEAKINGRANLEFANKKMYLGLAAASILIGLTAFALPDKKTDLISEAYSTKDFNRDTFEWMTADELAFRIMDDEADLQIFDLRSSKDFSTLSLPKSQNIKLENLFEKDIIKQLSLRGKINVFISGNDTLAQKAAFISSELGYKNNHVLQGGMNNFAKEIINFTNPGNADSKQLVDTYRFRESAATAIPVLIKENKQKQSSGGTKKAKRVLGGC